MATHPDAKICYRASDIDMVLNVHSNASYLSAPNARSHAGGYFFSAAFHAMIPCLPSMAPSTLPAQFSSWLLHLPLKLILVLTSLMHKKQRSYTLSSNNLVTRNHPFPFTLTTPQLSAL
jgi:hypothetical protein